ncbi:MAG: flagellar biosynthetic protein FliQ [Mariniblastus sp.]|nr:flagellar biosynthetic protein FliQ [Mariniblastus sp.]
MEPQNAVEAGQQVILVCLSVGGPILAAGLLIAIVIGVIQAMTHIQDQTVSFVPKIILIAAVLAISLPWLTEYMVQYSASMLETPFLIGMDGKP